MIWGLGIGDWGFGGWGVGAKPSKPTHKTPTPHTKNIFFIFKKKIKNFFGWWVLGFGFFGLWFWGLAPTPQPPIPNPQSPIPIEK